MTLIAVALALSVMVGDPLTTRIEDANAAAQALQGPFDGAWSLSTHDGRVLYDFQMSDPPGSAGGLVQGAWRDADGRVGRADFAAMGDHRLRIELDGGSPPAIDLVPAGRGLWRGSLPGQGAATLTRGLATPRPAV